MIGQSQIAIVESALLGSVQWAGVVVDEAHRLKGRGNKLGDVLRKIEFGWQFSFESRLLLTGTPLQVGVVWESNQRTTPRSCGRC